MRNSTRERHPDQAEDVGQLQEQRTQAQRSLEGRHNGRQRFVGGVGDEQRAEQPAEHLAEELVEDAAGDPLGDRRQREDVADRLQVDAAGDGRPGADRPDHLGHDMGAHRGVEWVGVVGEGAGRVELVAVLAVDELVGQRREAGRVRQPDHVDQPGLLEGLSDAGVPPKLGVVVANQVDHPVPLGTGERPQRGEQLSQLGPGQRRRHRVATAGFLHAQQVENVPGQDQLDGKQRLVREPLPEDAISGHDRDHRAAPVPAARIAGCRFGGGPRRLGRHQPDPGTAYRGVGSAARQPGNPHLWRTPAGRGQRPQRDPGRGLV